MTSQTRNIFQFLAAIGALAFSLLTPAAGDAQTFTLDNPLLGARWNHGAVLLPNGSVLITGGRIANDGHHQPKYQWLRTL